MARNAAAVQQRLGRLALISIADIGVFFAVLLVGFAYVWKRGDLDWVRAVTRRTTELPAHRTRRPARRWSRASRCCRPERGLRAAGTTSSELDLNHMTGPAFVDQLKAKFGDKITGANLETIDPWIEVTAGGSARGLPLPARRADALRSTSELHHGGRLFRARREEGRQDRLAAAPGSGLSPSSMPHKHSLVLKVMLPRWKRRPAGRTARGAERRPAFGARPTGTSARCST